MSIAIVIIVTIFGARVSGEVPCSSGAVCSATELCVLKWGELSRCLGLMLIIISYFWLYLEASEEYY